MDGLPPWTPDPLYPQTPVTQTLNPRPPCLSLQFACHPHVVRMWLTCDLHVGQCFRRWKRVQMSFGGRGMYWWRSQPVTYSGDRFSLL